LNEINENLQRIRTLSVQAANGSNASLDLNSIQKEISQRMSEISRIGAQTQFNGKKILSQDATFDFQVGAFDDETVSIGMKEMSAKSLGVFGYNVNGVDGATNATTMDEIARFAPSLKAVDVAAGVFDATGVDLGGQLGFSDPTSVKISGSPIVETDAKGNIFVQVDLSTAVMTQAEKDTLASQGIDIATATTAYIAATSSMFSDSATAGNVTVDLSGVSSMSALVGAKTTAPLATLDSAISKVDDLRSTFGAVQNRFASIISNLNNTTNNLSAARSRIEDADMAVEVSNMSRAQILQQAGTSVLSQANQVPQTVLSLLR